MGQITKETIKLIRAHKGPGLPSLTLWEVQQLAWAWERWQDALSLTSTEKSDGWPPIETAMADSVSSEAVVNCQHLRMVCWNHDATTGQCQDCGVIIDPPTSRAARDVLKERNRQISVEGWTTKHDDAHSGGELALAASCYAAHTGADMALHARALTIDWHHKISAAQEFVGRHWPWAREWWKPKDHRSNLVRAGALILAEIERIDRAAPKAAEKSGRSES